MEIITSLPKYHDGEINSALMREIKLGLNRERVTEGVRIKNAAEYRKTFEEAKEVPGLGLHVGAMPARDYFRLVKKYGHAEVHSDKFLRRMRQDMPGLVSAKI